MPRSTINLTIDIDHDFGLPEEVTAQRLARQAEDSLDAIIGSPNVVRARVNSAFLVREEQAKRLPPEGWGEERADGHLTYVRHGLPYREGPPEREGFEPYFIAVHGADYTRWTYRPAPSTVDGSPVVPKTVHVDSPVTAGGVAAAAREERKPLVAADTDVTDQTPEERLAHTFARIDEYHAAGLVHDATHDPRLRCDDPGTWINPALDGGPLVLDSRGPWTDAPLAREWEPSAVTRDELAALDDDARPFTGSGHDYAPLGDGRQSE